MPQADNSMKVISVFNHVDILPMFLLKAAINRHGHGTSSEEVALSDDGEVYSSGDEEGIGEPHIRCIHDFYRKMNSADWFWACTCLPVTQYVTCNTQSQIFLLICYACDYFMLRVRLDVLVELPLSLRSDQIYDKRFPCVYCGEMQSALGRHLLKMHTNEDDVKKALAAPKKSTERKSLLAIIRKKGSFIHNSKVLASGKGVLIVERRSSVTTYKPSDYRPCSECHGFYHKRTLWKHMDQHCSGKYDRIDAKCLYSALLGAEDTKITKVLATMSENNITDICKNDPLLITYGKQLYRHHSHSKENLVSGKMRELGRLVHQIRSKKPGITMTELICPANYDTIIDGVRTLCNFDTKDKSKSTPSLALKIGHAVKKCAAIIRNKAIRDGTPAIEMTIKQYLKLHDSEWGSNITRYALDALEVKKKASILPVTEDLDVSDTIIIFSLSYNCII